MFWMHLLLNYCSCFVSDFQECLWIFIRDTCKHKNLAARAANALLVLRHVYCMILWLLFPSRCIYSESTYQQTIVKGVEIRSIQRQSQRFWEKEIQHVKISGFLTVVETWKPSEMELWCITLCVRMDACEMVHWWCNYIFHYILYYKLTLVNRHI